MDDPLSTNPLLREQCGLEARRKTPGAKTNLCGARRGDGSAFDGNDVTVRIGIIRNIDWLAESDIELQDGFVCDNDRTSVQNMFALAALATASLTRVVYA